jgi:hypothetical protein
VPLPPEGVVPVSAAGLLPLQMVWLALMVLLMIGGITLTITVLRPELVQAVALSVTAST